MIEEKKIQFHIKKSKNEKLDRIYHICPEDFDNCKIYKSKIICTEFLTSETKYTMIDGNHHFEHCKRNKRRYTCYFISYHDLVRECYCDDFSFYFHAFINELPYLLINNNSAECGKVIEKSRLMFIEEE